jgi:hypothetical protein
MVVGFCKEEVYEHCHPLDIGNMLQLFVEFFIISYDYVKYLKRYDYSISIWSDKPNSLM